MALAADGRVVARIEEDPSGGHYRTDLGGELPADHHWLARGGRKISVSADGLQVAMGRRREVIVDQVMEARLSTWATLHDDVGATQIVAPTGAVVACSYQGELVQRAPGDDQAWDLYYGRRTSLVALDGDEWAVMAPDGSFDVSSGAWQHLAVGAQDGELALAHCATTSPLPWRTTGGDTPRQLAEALAERRVAGLWASRWNDGGDEG